MAPFLQFLVLHVCTSLKQLVSVTNLICLSQKKKKKPYKTSNYLHRQLTHNWKWNAARKLTAKKQTDGDKDKQGCGFVSQAFVLMISLIECAR